MKKVLAAAALSLSALFVMAQLVPVKPRTNPPVDRARTIEANLELTPEVEKIVSRSCKNCHSYETDWPWYSKIAPVSWMIAHDVERARKAVNLSDWTLNNGRTPGAARGTLVAACAGVESGRMPPAPYLKMHPEARVSAGEAKAFCAWTMAQMRQLRRAAPPAAGQ